MYAPTLEIKQFLGKGEDGHKKVLELKSSLPEWIFYKGKIIEGWLAESLNPIEFLRDCGLTGKYTFCKFVPLEELTNKELDKLFHKNLYKKGIYSTLVKKFAEASTAYIKDFDSCPFRISDKHYWIYSFELNDKGVLKLPELELIAEKHFEPVHFFEPYGYLLI